MFRTIVPMAAVEQPKIKVDQQPINQPLIEQDVLAYLRNNPQATQQDIVQALGLSLYAIKNAIAQAQKAGMLKREGAKKNGRWIVQLPQP